MTLSARRLDVARRQDGLLPRQRAAVGFLNSSCRTLSAMTHDATELVERVRYCRMLAEWLRADIGQGRFFQAGVAGGAAIHDSELRQPDLLDSVMVVKVALQCDRVASVAN